MIRRTASRLAVGVASVDRVRLDARHDHIGLKADIQAWLPKAKPGGWLSGGDFDDVRRPEVVRAGGESVPGARPWADRQWRRVIA
jgi:hypothetical protein